MTLIASMTVSLGVSAISLRSLSAQKQAAGWRDHTYKVLGVLQNIVEAMVNQETGMRGYVISGDEKFLDPQKAGAATYADNLLQVRTLTSDNPVQQRRIDELDVIVKTWTQKVVDPELALMKNASTYEQTRQIESSGAGKASMDGIRAKVKEMAGDEAALLITRAATADAAASSAQLAIYGGGGAMLLVAVIGMYLLNVGLVRPINETL